MSAYTADMNLRFARAARHSRLVRLLRVAVPAVVALSLAAIVAVSVFNPFRLLAKLPIDTDRLVVSGTKITMEAPHLAGFSPDGRPYELWAKTATQDLTDPNKVGLNTVRAKIVTEDRSTVTMDARDGVFDTRAQLLDLRKDIYLQTTTGYEAWMTQALVDIAKGDVTSDQPVDVRWTGGTVRGQRLRVTDRGEVLRFEGGVVMNLDNGGAMPSFGGGDPEPIEAAPPRAAPNGKAR